MWRIKGYVTVMLSMILGILIIFIITVIECARYQTLRMEAECVMDAGMNSIFAEYHRELVRQYGMMFIDDSYGGNGNTEQTRQQLLYHLNLNCNSESKEKDITGLRIDNAIFDAVSFASDKNGSVLRYQIYCYMKQNKHKYRYFNRANLSEVESRYEEYNNRREAVHGVIDEIIARYNEELPEDEEPVSISNPADAVEFINRNNAVMYAFNDLQKLSTNSTNTDSLISNRGYTEGDGLYDEQMLSTDENQKAYYSYLFDRLGFYGHNKENACLNYQLEYIIGGNSDDIENIAYVIEKIFKARYMVNINHLNGCTYKQEEAAALATEVSAVIGTPELINAVKESIILAWAYAESARDLRILMDGNRLSLNKSEADWNVSIEDIPNYKSNLNNYNVPYGIMSYEDYLYSYLTEESIEKETIKLMDVMEMDIRITSGNHNFRMDNQIYQLTATVNCSGKYKGGVQITRNRSFW